MLTVCTWLWGEKFGIGDVDKLASGVRRNLKQDYRFVCIHDKGYPGFSEDVHCSWPILDEGLTQIRGCYARLRLFDPEWQRMYPCNLDIYGNRIADRLVGIDLDTVITGPLDPLFDRPEPFVIMQKGNASNPCPYNGALMMLRVGEHSDVWSDFSVDAASKVPFFEFPDDQGWLWHKIPNAAGWKCGAGSGVYVFHKPGWPGWKSTKDSMPDDGLPPGARLVTFSGWRNPKRFKHLDWVKENWR